MKGHAWKAMTATLTESACVECVTVEWHQDLVAPLNREPSASSDAMLNRRCKPSHRRRRLVFRSAQPSAALSIYVRTGICTSEVLAIGSGGLGGIDPGCGLDVKNHAWIGAT